MSSNNEEIFDEPMEFPDLIPNQDHYIDIPRIISIQLDQGLIEYFDIISQDERQNFVINVTENIINNIRDNELYYNHVLPEDSLPEDSLPDHFDFLNDLPLEDMDFPEGFLEPVKVVLSNDEFDDLPVRTMSKNLEKELNIRDKTCPICQEEINSRCHCTVLKCGHFFHKNCAKEWLTKQCEKPTCPMCRKDVREDLS